MDHIIDARAMTVHQSWPLIQKNMKELSFHSITTVTDTLEKAHEIQGIAQESGIDAFLEESGGEYLIHLSQTSLQEADKFSASKASVIVISGCTFGRGDQELGKALMKSYFYHLKQCTPCPKTLIFLNSGVALAAEGSEVLKDLRVLEGKGVEILSSDTCLSYYGLSKCLQAGRTAGMKEIVQRMHRGENTLIL